MADTLEERFWKLASQRLAAAQIPLMERIDIRFQNFVRSGATTMQSGGVAENQEQLELAEKSLVRIVDGLIRETREREVAAVNRSVYDFVIGRFCPAWPFC